MDPEIEVLTVTLTERDKRALKVLAAVEGRTMRDIVRALIRETVANTCAEVRDDAVAPIR